MLTDVISPVLAAYLHRLSPFLFEVTDGIGIRWYGLSYVAAFLTGYAVVRGLSRRGLSPLPEKRAGDYIIALALGTVIGGRIGYCVFYSPELITSFTPSPPFWGLLAINKGGMASHGGIIGIIAACVIFARRNRVPAFHLFDLVALTGCIGIFFGRVANFINGELLGRKCAPDFVWAVKFPQEIVEWPDAKLRSAAFQKVQQQANAVIEATPGGSGCTPATGELGRVVEATRQDDGVAAAIEPLLTPRHPSQLYEALLEGLVVFLVLWWIWRKPRKPGVIGAWFLLVYAAVRIIGEQFRLPDAHIANQEFDLVGITRGQWLSALMFLAGIVCMVKWSQRPVEKIGGWWRRKKVSQK